MKVLLSVLLALLVLMISKTAKHQALMALQPGAVVAVVEAELTTPQRPTAECKGAEEMAEAVKVERQAVVVQVGRQVQAVAVAVKIRNCLKCLILRSVMATASLTGVVLNLMAISALLDHLPLLALGGRVLKI